MGLDKIVTGSLQCVELEKVILGSDKEIFFQVRTQLPLAEKEKLLIFLKNNLDVFAWNPYEDLRVDPEFICHHLNVNLAITSKRQQPR